MDLLLVCWQVYMGAVEVLCGCNTFVTNDPKVLLYLDDYYLPQRTLQIKDA